MTVVFDTNILISALLSPGGKQALAVDLFRHQLLTAAVSAPVLAEYQRVLASGKFKFSSERQEEMLRPFFKHAKHVMPRRTLTVSPDPADNRFLECAEAAQADFLVTGNLKDFPQRHGTTEVLSTADFLARLNIPPA